jgi:hypothetical protein
VLEGPELRLVMMNRRMRELFPDRDLLGVSFRELVPPATARCCAGRVFATASPKRSTVIDRTAAARRTVVLHDRSCPSARRAARSRAS